MAIQITIRGVPEKVRDELARLAARLARANGPTCKFLTPSAASIR
jgi:hypothetical protein